MKTVPLPASVLAVLAAALVAASFPVQPAFAQNQTEAKIRLMSEALRARDAGDLAGAQQALTRLASLSPNDPAVQKLRAEIEAQAIAQQNALAQRAAAEAAAAATQATIPPPTSTPLIFPTSP
ncbi:MAG: type II secretory pathway, component PulD, partial [Opitutaceae bacterium]